MTSSNKLLTPAAQGNLGRRGLSRSDVERHERLNGGRKQIAVVCGGLREPVDALRGSQWGALDHPMVQNRGGT